MKWCAFTHHQAGFDMRASHHAPAYSRADGDCDVPRVRWYVVIEIYMSAVSDGSQAAFLCGIEIGFDFNSSNTHARTYYGTYTHAVTRP